MVTISSESSRFYTQFHGIQVGDFASFKVLNPGRYVVLNFQKFSKLFDILNSVSKLVHHFARFPASTSFSFDKKGIYFWKKSVYN